MKELKIRLHQDWRRLEKKLIKLGATYIKTLEVKDTYFEVGPHETKKIQESADGIFLSRYVRQHGKSDILPVRQLTSDQAKKIIADNKVKKIIRKQRVIYKLDDQSIEFNLIKHAEDFMILVAVDPEIGWIKRNLISSPDVFKGSFGEL